MNLFGASIVIALCLISFVSANTCLLSKISGVNDLCTHMDENGTLLNVEPKRCQEHAHCCLFDDTCYLNLNGAASAKKVKSESEIAEEKKRLRQKNYEDATSSIDKVSKRYLALPGIPGCPRPIPFPAKCQIQVNEPYVFDPPVNIPYCLRIPCAPGNNKELDRDIRLCGTQAGCYFDSELREYREAFGDSIMPGVPVCHLAIRNAVFQREAAKVVSQQGLWNPYYTNCLINEFYDEISKGPKGCDLIPILRIFKVQPKMAGWSHITSSQCSLIDGCWIHGEGCFYPVDASNVITKSGQRSIPYSKSEISYGRPKCQYFDTTSSYTILNSYHQCLKSGCTVDRTIVNRYYSHLFAIGESMSVSDHWKYWSEVEEGRIGAHNIEEISYYYNRNANVTGSKIHPKPNLPFNVPGVGLAPFPLPTKKFSPGNLFAPFPNPDLISGSSYSCGIPFKHFGGRPCKPPTFTEILNPYCPYRPLHVPRFPALKGSFDDCCNINLCYLPKLDISRMHSGPSHYYSMWSYWTKCSSSCGTGKKTRTRRCLGQDQARCTEQLRQTVTCQEKACAQWGPWGPFSPCAKSCYPGGKSSRRRICYPLGGHCKGQNEEVKTCNEHPCPSTPVPKGVWTNWKNEECKYEYTKGVCEQSRTRYCTYNGIPGGYCIGSTTHTKKYSCSGCKRSF